MQLYINHASHLNPLSANITKWSNTLKQFIGKFPMNFLSVFDHFVGLALKGLRGFKGCAMSNFPRVDPKLGQ